MSCESQQEVDELWAARAAAAMQRMQEIDIKALQDACAGNWTSGGDASIMSGRAGKPERNDG